MSNRTTRAQIDAKCRALNLALGRPTETYTKQADGHHKANIGNISVDKNLCGYSIEQMTNASGGVSHPFGSYQMNAFTCWVVLNAACAAVDMATRNSIAVAA